MRGTEQTNEAAFQGSGKTIGDVLYVGETSALVLEYGWAGLVECIAAGDQFALHTLYQWTYQIAFTLALRLLKNEEAAAEVTLGVFQEVWRRAKDFDHARTSVVGWISNLTRERALASMWFVPEAGRPSFVEGADVVKPSEALGSRLIWWLGQTTGKTFTPSAAADRHWAWKEVAPGISCHLLSTDHEHKRVSMLVRLARGADYPPHRHAGFEELHLLHGELTINDRKLFPGDYSRAEAGTVDTRVWSGTGCTCVLVTSTQDELR